MAFRHMRPVHLTRAQVDVTLEAIGQKVEALKESRRPLGADMSLESDELLAVAASIEEDINLLTITKLKLEAVL